MVLRYSSSAINLTDGDLELIEHIPLEDPIHIYVPVVA